MIIDHRNSEGGPAALRYFLTAAVVLICSIAYVYLPPRIAAHLSDEVRTYYFDPSKGLRGESTHSAHGQALSSGIRRFECSPTDRKEREENGGFSHKCRVFIRSARTSLQEMEEIARTAQGWIIETYRPLPVEAGDFFVHAFSEERKLLGVLPEDQVVGLLKVAIAIALVLTIRRTVQANSSAAKARYGSRVLVTSLVALPVFAVFSYAVWLIFLQGNGAGGAVAGVMLATSVWRGLVIAPIAEELFFRVWMLTRVERTSGTFSALVWSTSIFVIAHAPNNWSDAATFVVGGLLLGLVWVAKRSILLNVLAHALVNSVILVLNIIES